MSKDPSEVVPQRIPQALESFIAGVVQAFGENGSGLGEFKIKPPMRVFLLLMGKMTELYAAIHDLVPLRYSYMSFDGITSAEDVAALRVKVSNIRSIAVTISAALALMCDELECAIDFHEDRLHRLQSKGHSDG